MSPLSKDQKRRKMLQRRQKKHQEWRQKEKVIRGCQAVQQMNQERQSALEGWEPLKLITKDDEGFKNLENTEGHPWPVIKASRWANREWACWLLEGETDVHIVIMHFSGDSVTPWHDWVIFQQIKNELVGTEQDMAELYPAESRLLNSSHMYHLWGKKGTPIQLGWLLGNSAGYCGRRREVERPAEMVEGE